MGKQNEKIESFETVLSISEERIEELRERAKEKALTSKHNWRQSGGWVKCTSCTYPHAFRVNGGIVMRGIDENGIPVLEGRS